MRNNNGEVEGAGGGAYYLSSPEKGGLFEEGGVGDLIEDLRH